MATRRLVACSGPVRTSERCPLGDRSDQRPMALRRDLIMRNSPRGPQRNAVPGVYRWRASICWRLCATHDGSRWRRCLEWPQAVSGSPQWGDPINRPGDKASCCCPGASSLKQVHEALRASWRVATHRHKRSIEVTLVDCACQGVASHKLSTLVTISFTRPSDATSYMKMRIFDSRLADVVDRMSGCRPLADRMRS